MGNGTKFILLASPRTGSTLLKTLLDSHPDILVFGELFVSFDHIDWANWKELRDPAPLLGEFQARSYESVCNHIYTPYARNGRAVGFKLFYHQARAGSQAGLWERLREDREIHVLHLVRRNKLKQLVSQEIAQATHAWDKFKNDQLPPSVTIYLEPTQCEAKLHHLERCRLREKLAFKEHPYLELCYEDLVLNGGEVLARVLAFLKVPPHPLKSHLCRQSSRPLREVLENYGELAAHFSGTPWSHCFEEAGTADSP
jgi:LPS sulfotransferase NodH